MVKVHELDVCGGVAGKLVRIDGVMLHNTSDDLPALEHAERLRKASFEQLMKGFAHYFIDDKDDVRTEQTFNATFHSANYNGNYFLISIEIVGGVKSDKKKFLQAEQNAFWRAAIELRYYKLPVNRNTVRLHCELDVGTYTECPKRSMIEHGNWNSTNRQPQEAINKVKDYYIKEIKKYYDNPKLQPGGTEVAKVKNNRKPHFVVTGDYRKATTASRKVENFLKKEGMKHKVVSDKKDRDKVWFVVGSFGQDSTWKLKLEQFLQDNNYSYVVCLEKQTQMLIDKW